MLEDQTIQKDTAVVDTSHELKWMRTVRRRAINILARIEYDRRPTQLLSYEIRKLHEAFVWWNSDTAMWEKHQMILPTKLEPQATLQKPNVTPMDVIKDVDFMNYDYVALADQDDIWYEEKTFLWVKAAFDKTGYWEYRINTYK